MSRAAVDLSTKDGKRISNGFKERTRRYELGCNPTAREEVGNENVNYVDGSVGEGGKSAACGGLLRDSSGTWIKVLPLASASAAFLRLSFGVCSLVWSLLGSTTVGR
ncbi:uncharacterized protein G2W53_030885 [Senna tora]|uniref:Uncharacterized protein n=1 Tax=Senna tora TaxID=362788 RepID=A0A834T9T7_9FABA|nr:uncharacterized protein G2W53_030885 [Senna tora]